MSEGWSLGRRDLVPSNGAVTHFDPRMHLSIKDIPDTSVKGDKRIALVTKATEEQK
jgi:hypothetical protein